MATKIRLRRVGRSKQASFRIVVAGSIHSRGGRVTETIGKYNPRTNPSYIEVDQQRALYWLRQGAELSESVRPLFRKVGIMKKFAEGADAEGVVTIGDPQGKTNIVKGAPAAPETKAETAGEVEAEAKEKKPVAKARKPKAAKPAEAPEAKAAESSEAPAAAAEAESKAEPAAEGEGESDAATGDEKE